MAAASTIAGEITRGMPRYVALLRGINVGRHLVKMDWLRQQFADLGFRSISTLIASGNVLFESPSSNTAGLERRIEGHLESALGYEVGTFLRTAAEIAAVAGYEAFPSAGETAVYVLFLRGPLAREAQARVIGCGTKHDEFHVKGREVYWLARAGMGRTAVNATALGKATGLATARNVNTVRKLAVLMSAPSARTPRSPRSRGSRR